MSIKFKRIILLATVAALIAPLHAETSATSKTRAHVTALASEGFQGRLTGTDGERKARDYLIGELQRIGAKPMPGAKDFLQPFEFTAGTSDGGSRLQIKDLQAKRAQGFDTAKDVRALSFSDNGDVTGDVIFAGYGIVVPDAANFAYNSYATLDVKDKIVLVLRYFPEDAEPKTKGILAHYADLRYKAMAARQRGAKALLVVAGP
ncbi:MAG TPA: hypothetical protein VET48_06115, partial [Steroidobacteraceae bacterium]|nr:hypothetical protein [Steroidobacteraceae bacterium]